MLLKRLHTMCSRLVAIRLTIIFLFRNAGNYNFKDAIAYNSTMQAITISDMLANLFSKMLAVNFCLKCWQLWFPDMLASLISEIEAITISKMLTVRISEMLTIRTFQYAGSYNSEMLASIIPYMLTIVMFRNSGTFYFSEMLTTIYFRNAGNYNVPKCWLSQFPQIRIIIIFPGADNNYNYDYKSGRRW